MLLEGGGASGAHAPTRKTLSRDIAHASSLLEDEGSARGTKVGVWVNGPGDVRLVSFTPLTLPARTGQTLRGCSGQAAGIGPQRSLLALQ